MNKLCENTTIDNYHHSIINKINENKNNLIPVLKKEKKELIEKFNNNKKSLTLDEKNEIKDRIYKIKKEIFKLDEKNNNYLLNNSKYIFDYFEKKKQISDGSINNISTKLDFFFNSKKKTNTTNYTTINPKYFKNESDQFLNINTLIKDYSICDCGGELIPIEHEGILMCNKCSEQQPYLIENEKPSYKEPPKEVCFYAYKRINHFREILAQLQAKETTQIPPEVINNIKLQIKKERITIDQITNKKTKDILKKLGYNKYYEHIPYIKDKLGIKPPVMSQELEITLCNLFTEIQRPYAKNCPDDRVNFLNYYYTIYKLCELLNQNDFLQHLPMLKDREKKIEQDAIWKKICAEMNWEFIPTI